MFRRIRERRQAKREAREAEPSGPPPPQPDGPKRRPGLLVRIAVELLKQLLAKAPGSIKGQIDLKEMAKAIATAVSGGGIVGLLILVLTAVSASAATIFPNPLTASLATFGIGLVVDLLRRQADGVTPINLPANTPVSVPGSFVPAGGLQAEVMPPSPPIKLGPLQMGPAGSAKQPSGLDPFWPEPSGSRAAGPPDPMTGPAGVVR